jgi:hypothetical protein
MAPAIAGLMYRRALVATLADCSAVAYRLPNGKPWTAFAKNRDTAVAWVAQWQREGHTIAKPERPRRPA